MNTLPVEIFRDAKTPCVDARLVALGLNYVNSTIGNTLALVDGTREINPTAPFFSPVIQAESTSHFIDTDVAMRLVITDRPVEVEGTENAIGFSLINNEATSGIAVISTHKQPHSRISRIVAHEIGHLLALGDQIDESGELREPIHCPDTTCLMATNIMTRSVIDRYREFTVSQNREYCTPCSTRMASHALHLIGRRTAYQLA